MSQCVGIKNDGNRCSIMCFHSIGEEINPNTVRCGTHKNTMHKKGPNTCRRDELKYVHQKKIKDIRIFISEHRVDYENAHIKNAETARLTAGEDARYRNELNELETRIAEETRVAGIDLDHEARAAQRERDRARYQRWRARQEIREQFHLGVRRPDPIIIPERREGLAAIANDNQNVHTRLVIEKVKKVIENVTKIPVPPDYQTDTLKTPGEIILECNLTKRSAWQMMAKYCGDENIYEMGDGIYARVLNSVWQYIKTSSNSEDLKKILRSEMEDNVGMCAQGNLSRLCNILVGYMDEVSVDTKSKNEILGELFSRLLETETEFHNRLDQAEIILRDNQVPEEEWPMWIEPLIE